MMIFPSAKPADFQYIVCFTSWKCLPFLIPIRLLSNFGVQDDHWLVRSELKVLPHWISGYILQQREILFLPSDEKKYFF